jgi:hypothetical protein
MLERSFIAQQGTPTISLDSGGWGWKEKYVASLLNQLGAPCPCAVFRGKAIEIRNCLVTWDFPGSQAPGWLKEVYCLYTDPMPGLGASRRH